MKNYDSLMKRVELFERLALYGSRKTFLQSLAQETAFTQQFGPDVRALLETVSKDFGALGVDQDPSITVEVADALNNFESINLPALIKALQKATTYYPRDRAAGQLGNLRLLITKLQNPQTSSQEVAQQTTPPSKSKSSPSPIMYDPYVKALQQFLIAGPWGLQKGVDGKFGPDTMGALKKWQEANGLKPTGQLDSSTVAAINPYVQRYFTR